MRSHRIATALTTAALAALLLGGCAAASSSDPGVAYPESAQDAGGQYAEADPGSASTTVDDRSVVTTGSMSISSSDVGAATESAATIAAELGGRIDSRSEDSTRGGWSTLTIRVPADEYENLIEKLRPLGTVQSVETDVVDVTLEQADLDARIESLRSSVTSLRAMLEKTTNVTDLLAVETQLSEREAELQSLEAQKSALDDQVSMSTLWVHISNDEIANPGPSDQPGFFGGLQAGWNTFVLVLQGLLTALGFALPGLVFLAILAGILFVLIRALVRRSRRRAATVAHPAPAGVAWNTAPTDHGDANIATTARVAPDGHDTPATPGAAGDSRGAAPATPHTDDEKSPSPSPSAGPEDGTGGGPTAPPRDEHGPGVR
ncbi:hypothetical protein HNR16_000618 [Pseudoclavibacter chungangensis]|nr:DUF4349 domain-containing protein [Pseudoclavibacter chungangensis]NYJ65830.1 hypothetical protein [Pseudoclavibacter chungangensis]